MITETAEVIWMILIFIQGHSCARNQVYFYTNFFTYLPVHMVEMQYAATTCWHVVLNFLLDLFCPTEIHGRTLYLCDFFYII